MEIMPATNIKNGDAERIIEAAKADDEVGHGADEFTIDPSTPGPYWTQALGSSFGSSRIRMLIMRSGEMGVLGF